MTAAALRSPPARHRRHALRVRRMLLTGSAAVVAICSFWGVYFTLHGTWHLVAMDVACVALAAGAWQLVRAGRTRVAAGLLTALMYLVLVVNAIWIDVPTPAAPRSVHSLLIGLGIIAALLMRDEPPWLRHGVPLLFLATFAVFASTTAGPVTSLALPDEVRAGGVWINHFFAVVLMYAALRVFQADVSERSSSESDLQRALRSGEFQLHYQPQLDEHGRVLGAEALLRWPHPMRGMVSPGEFIPQAEAAGLMPALGDWVLAAACTRLAQWRSDPLLAGLQLSVNVSASQLAQPDFVAQVLRRVREAGIDPTRLKLELTESTLADDLEELVTKMAVLKANGIGFSLDDFGTGFSSLSYLRRLPLDQLKIDQSFVRSMLESPSDAAIAQTIVALGRTLGLQVIAEGVETAAQHEFLKELGCMAYQGYLFSRPVPAADFEQFVGRTRLPDGVRVPPTLPRSPAADGVPVLRSVQAEPSERRTPTEAAAVQAIATGQRPETVG